MPNWKELEKKYYMQLLDRVPVTLVKGQGARVWDDTGKEYLDFVAGWAVDCLGHGHPVLTEAIITQARILVQTSNQFFTVPQVELAELLVKNSCLDRVFLCSTGLEANEAAVKLARRYGALKLNGAYEVITASNSFHGRSLAMTAATGQEKFHKPYEPLPDWFQNVPYNDIAALEAATSPKTCAIMLEPVQGEGGVNVPDTGYLKAVRQWCDDKGILLIFDEIQTGVCRLGPLWGYQAFGVEPDIMTLAKGLAGGVPIGAMLAREHCAVFGHGEHGSTFGGNPLTCAAAVAVMDHVIAHDFPKKVKEASDYLFAELKKLKQEFPFITEVRGMGLLAALAFDSDIGQEVLTGCLEHGLLVNAVKPNAVRLMPPLIITSKEIDEAVGILRTVLSGRTP
jgi:acetylornithine/N-succinyldiaminopimelate aminotransferase